MRAAPSASVHATSSDKPDDNAESKAAGRTGRPMNSKSACQPPVASVTHFLVKLFLAAPASFCAPALVSHAA